MIETVALEFECRRGALAPGRAATHRDHPVSIVLRGPPKFIVSHEGNKNSDLHCVMRVTNRDLIASCPLCHLAGFLHCASETRWQRFWQFLNDFLIDLLDDFLYENP